MFRVIVDGKSPADLKTNLEMLLKAWGNENKQVTISQSTNFDPVPMTQAPTEEIDEIGEEPAVHPFTATRVAAQEDMRQAALQETADAAQMEHQDVSTLELDSTGLPWDRRIHSDTKGKTKDGIWRSRRHVDKTFALEVEQQLRGKSYPPASLQQVPAAIPQFPNTNPTPSMAFGETAPAPTLSMLTTPSAPVAAPPLQSVQPAIQNEPFVPVFAPTPVAPSQGPASIAPQTSAHTLDTFRQHLVATLTRLINEKKIDQDYINQLKQFFGVEQIWNLKPEQSEQMFNSFVAGGLITKVG